MFIVALLLASLVLSALLAYQAQDAVRSHRASAESALRDYAAFAAWQYSQRLSSHMWYDVVWPSLGAIGEPGGGTAQRAVEPAARLSNAAAICRKKELDVRYFFHLDLETGELTENGTVPPTVRTWLTDTLQAHVRTVFGGSWEFAVVVHEGNARPRAMVYWPERDAAGAPMAAWGVVTDLAMPAVFGAAFEKALLPATLTRGLPNDSLLSVAVSSPHRRVLWMSSDRYPEDSQRFVRAERLDPMFGGILASVAIRPEAAEWLVIGGLPRSRLPLLLGLLLLTGGMVAVALWLMRQEYDLARLQAQFISSVSHELRTPLAQIRMFAETLLLGRTRSDDEKQRSLEVIDQESRRLAHLVDNVLQFSRAGRAVESVSPEPQELSPIVREVVERFEPIARARGVAIEVNLANGVIADVDAAACCQILLNLLDNAVKYGPVGQTIRVALDTRYEWARIIVDDEGPGVPRTQRQAIWEAFGRLERDLEAAVAGTGIGLAVVTDLVRRHDGRAWVTDAPGGGARFVVQLPLVERVSDDDLEDSRPGPETAARHAAHPAAGAGRTEDRANAPARESA